MVSLAVILAAILYSVPAGFGQRWALDFGVRGGVFAKAPPIEKFATQYSTPFYELERTNFSAGPRISAVIDDRVEVRFEAVRSAFQYYFRGCTRGCGTDNSRQSSTHGHIWQFPILATYRFGSETIRPFAGGGISPGSPVRGTVTSTVNPQTTSRKDYSYTESRIAYYLTGGVEKRLSGFVIQPEVRYGRWPRFRYLTLNSQNQLEFIVGFSFRAVSAN